MNLKIPFVLIKECVLKIHCLAFRIANTTMVSGKQEDNSVLLHVKLSLISLDCVNLYIRLILIYILSCYGYKGHLV